MYEIKMQLFLYDAGDKKNNDEKKFKLNNFENLLHWTRHYGHFP